MRRWRDLFRRRRLDAQFDTELEFHIQQLVEDGIREGLSAAEARRRAIVEFGGREQMKEELRDVHRMQLFDTTARNLKSAVRLLRKSPAFSLTLIATLALGIGANSAVLSAIDAIVLRPLPFPEADRLLSLHQYTRGQAPEVFVAPIRLEDWNRLNSTFDAITGYYTDDSTDTSGELPERLTIAAVAPRFLQVWGITPLAGRDFTPEEYREGGPKAALISERYARRHFGSPANAIGKTIRVGGGSVVVAVLPDSLAFPARNVDVWIPVPVDAKLTQNREMTWYRVVGRLKRGVALAQARADLATVQARLGKQFPKPDADLRVDVQPLKENTIGGVRRSLWVLFGAVSLLLLIACTNVSALLLARTADRRREIAIRFALGASRRAVVVQLLTETLVVALAGSAAGMAIVWGAGAVFRSLAKNMPRVNEIAMDWRVVLYTLISCLVSTFACGLLPALRFTRRTLSADMAQGGRGSVMPAARAHWLLVGIQVAFAVVLLAGAGLLLRTFQQLGRVSPGFEPAHVLTLHISGSWAETVDFKGVVARINNTLDALRATPGVEAAATSVMLPGVDSMPQIELKIAEGTEDDRKVSAAVRFVSEGYFAAMKIPLMAGEPCPRSTGFETALVNNSFAGTYLAGRPAVGYHVRFDNSGGLTLPPARILGVVADAREAGIDKAPEPTVYWCGSAPTPSPYYVVRTFGDPSAMGEVVRRKIHEIEPTRSVFDIVPLERHLYDAFGERRLRAVLLSLFALTAVSLACVGLYGTLTYVVAVRRREIGVRIALGALRGGIARQFLLRGIGVSLAGCLVGICLALALTRLLAGMLYGVAPSDPATFASVLAVVLAVGALASLWPAIRAARVEPMQVLRDE